MSIFDHPDTVAAAPSFRCPHCGQLQAETPRCWRCGRAAVTCASCHRFRRAVATGLGFCAADRSRAPLTGDEVHACWEAASASPAAQDAAGLFAELDAAPPAPLPPATTESARRDRPAKATKPPLEEPKAAAWADAPLGRLREAPTVAPGRQLTSELGRRRRARHGPR